MPATESLPRDGASQHTTRYGMMSVFARLRKHLLNAASRNYSKKSHLASRTSTPSTLAMNPSSSPSASSTTSLASPTTPTHTPTSLLSLPLDILYLLPHLLPYQDTLRLLATCHHLHSHLLTLSQLTALALRDPDEVYRTECRMLASLQTRPDWIENSWWGETRFAITTVPCYTCLQWKPPRGSFPWNNCWQFGVPSSRYRECYACRLERQMREPGFDEVKRFWKKCVECGRLAWKRSRAREMPEGAVELVRGRFCMTCVGVNEENLNRLMVRWNPETAARRKRDALEAAGDGVRATRRARRKKEEARELGLTGGEELGLAGLYV